MATSRRPERKGFEKILYEQHVERIKTMKGTVDNKVTHYSIISL